MQDFINSIFSFDANNQIHVIIRQSRLPRILSTALVGSALAVAGAIMQGVTRNPLADSSILGINAGASLGVAICFAFLNTMSFNTIIAFSFAGASITTILIFMIANNKRIVNRSGILVLAGMSITTLFNGLSQGIAISKNLSQDILFWTIGGVSGAGTKELKIIFFWVSIGLILSFLISKKINILNFGEEIAQNLGLNIAKLKILSIIATLILAGCAVSVVGSIAFVGLIIPHTVRFLVGSDYQKIIPYSALLGSFLLVLADILSRMVKYPFETPISILISFIGVPFFLYLARNKGRDS